MADNPKSKWPDVNEVLGIAGKLAKDVTSSVKEIVADYKKKRPTQKTEATETTEKSSETVASKEEVTKKPASEEIQEKKESEE